MRESGKVGRVVIEFDSQYKLLRIFGKAGRVVKELELQSKYQMVNIRGY